MDSNDSRLNGTIMNPTNLNDSIAGKEETVEVGVIVMGLSCICLVACALVVLQLRSNSRRISGNRQRAGHSGDVSEDRSCDPLDVAAPPSYDAVIRSPHLYPPSRQIPMSPSASESRRSSRSSIFSLSLHSPRLALHYLEVPRGTSEEDLSVHPSLQTSHEEDNEEPPPPYPGNFISTETGQGANPTDIVCQSNSRLSRKSAGHGEMNERTVKNELNRRNSGARESTSHMVDAAWTSREICSELCRTDICQSNHERRIPVCNLRQPNVFRTVVSYSPHLQHCRAAVTESLTACAEDIEFANTV